MQAASVDIQTSLPAIISDRIREPGGDLSGEQSRDKLQFRSVLDRLLGEQTLPEAGEKPRAEKTAKAYGKSSPKGATGELVVDPEDKPAANQEKSARSAGRLESSRREAVILKFLPGSSDASSALEESAGASAARAGASRSRQRETGRAEEDRVEERSKARGQKAEPLVFAKDPAVGMNATGAGPAARTETRKPDAEAGAQDGSSTGKNRNDRKPPRLSVLDLRMRPEAPESESLRDAKRQAEGPAPGREISPGGNRPADALPSSEHPAAAKTPGGTPFSDILARHIADAGAQDIVKAAQIVLRDGDSGLIRLRLEPESLGNVKIELKLTEKNITGRIVVESNEARDAFEKSLAGLREAFTAGGFETASLEVSVGGGETRGHRDASGERDDPFFSGRLRELERSVPAALETAYRTDGGVNIWA